jgi:hypothetical protein
MKTASIPVSATALTFPDDTLSRLISLAYAADPRQTVATLAAYGVASLAPVQAVGQ